MTIKLKNEVNKIKEKFISQLHILIICSYGTKTPLLLFLQLNLKRKLTMKCALDISTKCIVAIVFLNKINAKNFVLNVVDE
jgi:hypothetical protein